MPSSSEPPPGGEFLQWFRLRQEALDAVGDFTVIIQRNPRFKGWKVSRPVISGRGFALYALPPAGKEGK
jgi:hypothetical protein